MPYISEEVPKGPSLPTLVFSDSGDDYPAPSLPPQTPTSPPVSPRQALLAHRSGHSRVPPGVAGIITARHHVVPGPANGTTGVSPNPSPESDSASTIVPRARAAPPSIRAESVCSYGSSSISPDDSMSSCETIRRLPRTVPPAACVPPVLPASAAHPPPPTVSGGAQPSSPGTVSGAPTGARSYPHGRVGAPTVASVTPTAVARAGNGNLPGVGDGKVSLRGPLKIVDGAVQGAYYTSLCPGRHIVRLHKGVTLVFVNDEGKYVGLDYVQTADPARAGLYRAYDAQIKTTGVKLENNVRLVEKRRRPEKKE